MNKPEMSNVEISLEGVESPPWLERASSFAEAALKKLGKHKWYLSILFCDNKTIRSLNKQYRKIDEATDVLSFALGEHFVLGDIAISLEKLEENARRFNVSACEELRRLIIHGILHLAGMDHASNNKEDPMLVLQEKLLKELPLHIYRTEEREKENR